MSYGAQELIDCVRDARTTFWKHLDGITPEQADWKPYRQCKSINETLEHLLQNDRAALEMIANGKDPDESTPPTREVGATHDELRRHLMDTHQTLISFLISAYANEPITKTVRFYGQEMPLGKMLIGMALEDSYHTGQVAYLRQANDPSWDYYTAVCS